MRIPNADFARVDRKKLEAYLLSSTHPIGRSKAKFFQAWGFDESNMGLLEHALLDLVRTQEITTAVSSAYGTKYRVDGLLATPSGSQVKLRTIWIVETGEKRPRLVTAYPF